FPSATAPCVVQSTPSAFISIVAEGGAAAPARRSSGGLVRRGARRRGDRDSEREGCALADLALDADRSAMCLHDPLHDRESETGARATLAVRLPEAVEHVREVVGGDAASSVRDPDLYRAAGSRAGRIQQ